MPYEVDLAVAVEEALKDLPEQGHQEVMEVIAAALVQPGSWGWLLQEASGAFSASRRRVASPGGGPSA